MCFHLFNTPNMHCTEIEHGYKTYSLKSKPVMKRLSRNPDDSLRRERVTEFQMTASHDLFNYCFLFIYRPTLFPACKNNIKFLLKKEVCSDIITSLKEQRYKL